MKTTSLVAGVLLIGVGTASAFAHNGPRIFLTMENGKLTTNLDDFLNVHNITPDVRVFHGDFGQDAENPLANFTEFPGVSGSVIGDSALTTGASISFNILDAVTYWDGTGPVAFGPSPETISMSSGLDVATSAGGMVPGFTLVPSIPSADGWHVHPGYTLNSDALGQFHDGVYLLELNMTSDGLTTAPFWLVFGQNMADPVVDSAVDFVNGSAVPEPASLGLLGMGAACLMWKRRRRGNV